MVHHFLNRTPPSPDFPTATDLPHLSPHAAMAALGLLRLLIAAGHAEVYTAAGSSHRPRPLWNVWLTQGCGRRVELEVWAFEVLCRDDDPVDPDDGPETAA
jgi:hypothetical protein